MPFYREEIEGHYLFVKVKICMTRSCNMERVTERSLISLPVCYELALFFFVQIT